MKLFKSQDSQDAREDEIISVGTKIKIVAALVIVSLATYVAYWVQQPSEMKADVLSSDPTTTEQTTEETDTQNTEVPEVMETQVASTTETPAATEDTMEVAIADFKYDPEELTVVQGTTVIWTNQDQIQHTITGTDFSSKALKPGESFSYKFDVAGEYEYSCSFHPQMKGKIIVEASTTVPSEATETIEPATETTVSDETSAPETSAPETGAPETVAAETTSSGETATEALHGAAEEIQSDTLSLEPETLGDSKLATTGPEEYLYIVLGLASLYITRKKFFGQRN